ncbi:MAG TPA: M28 family peptidase [Pyrinomonadaceae bacterium]
MAVVSLGSLWLPTAPGGGPASFSVERAIAHVEALAAGPRPAGSAAHRAAREYIVTALREGAGLGAETRSAAATSTRYGVPYDAARVHNVVATIPGTDPSRRIVLVAHYDTVLTSPGAGDDAAGVATLLEAGRALAVEYGGAPEVTLLFTDAEEIGAIGAEAFLSSGGLDPERTTVLNFDARGTGGPCGLIETAGDEGRLVRTVARSGAPVVASSLLPALARFHGVGTDFRPFREAGAGGLNFAIVDGVARYHTPADTPPALDRESVRRQGEAAVRLVRALGDGADEGSGTVSYFTAPWAGLVVYPRFLDLLAAALATVLVAFWVVASVRRGHSSWAGLGVSGLAAVAAMALAAVACYAGWWLVRALGAGAAPGLADPYDPVPYRFAAVLLAAGTALGVARIARQIGVTAPTGLLPAIGVAVLWGLALKLPGAAYLLAVPMPFVALYAVASRGGRGAPVTRAFGAALASLPVVIVWAPVPYFLLAGLRLSAAWAAGAVAAFAVLLCASVFERARFAVDGRFAAALVLLAAVAAGVGVSRAGASPETPRPVSVAYALDADAGRAFWVSDRRSASGPEDSIFADALPTGALPRFLGEDGVLKRAAAAATHAVPGPEVALVDNAAVGGHRELTVRVRSRRGAPWLHVFVETGKVVGAAVDGSAFEEKAGGGVAEGAVWGFRHIGAGDEGFELKLAVDPAGGPVRLTVVDQSPGIDAPAAARPGPDAMYARSWVAGTTLVRRSYAF